MYVQSLPAIPLPDVLRGTDTGTFTEKTIRVRLPEIARRILKENDFPEQVNERIWALIDDLPEGRIRLLTDPYGPDVADWNDSIEPVVGLSWLEVPWFFAETYFYRRIAEATEFFGPAGREDRDPFVFQKRKGLETTRRETSALVERLDGWLNGGPVDAETVVALLEADLWGNQADLSMWPAGEDGQPRHTGADEARAHLVADQSNELFDYLQERMKSGRPLRVDFVLDNAGFELVSDLCLVDYLLATGSASVVYLQAKMHPTFVSDAVEKDVLHTFRFLEAENDPAVANLGRRLQTYQRQDRLRVRAHAYWTSPLSGWEMPEAVLREYAASDLLISKGDANYRRFLGDRKWPFTTPIGDILSYVPAPFLALRTLKSEVAAGLNPERVEKAARLDPDWLIDGRWGVIQFVRPV